MNLQDALKINFLNHRNRFIFGFNICQSQKHTVILVFIFSSILEADRECFC